MQRIYPDGEWCKFRVHCNGSQQVKLVIEFRPGASQIFSLQRVGPGVRELDLKLPAGEYRYCYHLYDGRSLTYLTPPGCEMDGLKAVLRVGRVPTATRHFRSAAPSRPMPRVLHDRRLLGGMTSAM